MKHISKKQSGLHNISLAIGVFVVISILVGGIALLRDQDDHIDIPIPTLNLEEAKRGSSSIVARLVGSTDNVEVHMFTEEEAAKGLTAPASMHTIFNCPANTQANVVSVATAHGDPLAFQTQDYWGYEYTGNETSNRLQGKTGRDLFEGRFWLSDAYTETTGGAYNSLNNVGMKMSANKRYYVMSRVDLRTSCLDTDNDGLNNGREDLNGNGEKDPNETDPNNADTDGGGLNDLDEIIRGKDSLNSNDDQRTLGDVTGDGVLGNDDASKIRDYVKGEINQIDIYVADVDQNGIVEKADAFLVLGAVDGVVELPAIYGDVTRNGRVTSYDASKVLRHANGLEILSVEQQYLGDVNYDGQLTEFDANIIGNMSVGNITDPPVVCGNDILNAWWGEECDDGNVINTDSCLNTCENARCGDGIVMTGIEQCDDGNSIEGDRCSNLCALEACGNGVVENTISDGATRTAIHEIENYLNTLDSDGILDIDGNGSSDALTDGILFQRYILNIRGDSLINGVVSPDATRTTAYEIESYIEDHIDEFDIDGDGTTSDNDGILIIKALFGFTGTALMGEECDDGNLDEGDGCDSSCMREAMCGDGYVDPSEQCENNLDCESGAYCNSCICKPYPPTVSYPSNGAVLYASGATYMRVSLYGTGNFIGSTIKIYSGSTVIASATTTNLFRQMPAWGISNMPLHGYYNHKLSATETRNGIESVHRPFSFELRYVSPAVCGNGTIEAAEQCDDGNTSSVEDGCSQSCQIDEGWMCSGGPSVCAFSDIPTLPSGQSVTEICDNGVDDDLDSLLDCNDMDCIGDPACYGSSSSGY
jgi:cysteine-rich repeat protein